MDNKPVIHIDHGMRLPDNDQWRFRFEIRSETSNRIYTIAQHIKGKYWGCSCPAWKRYRKCKHLTAMGIPNHQQPYECAIIS